MKNFPSILFFQFYRYSDELIEQSELKRAFVMNTTKGTAQDLTFTTETNVEGLDVIERAQGTQPAPDRSHGPGTSDAVEAAVLEQSAHLRDQGDQGRPEGVQATRSRAEIRGEVEAGAWWNT